MIFEIIDNNYERHHFWEEQIEKYPNHKIDYTNTKEFISIDMLDCNILLVHTNNHTEFEYTRKNKDKFNFKIIYFTGSAIEKEFNDGNWYIPIDLISDVFENPKEYC